MNPAPSFKVNNFDLIRLLAAAQVALYHAIHHMNPGAASQALSQALSYVPGVPVFFFVSGFLVSRSFESSPALPVYFANRALRVFPGLIVCTLLALIAVWVTGYWQTQSFGALELLAWVASQVTFLQFYNPDFMRDFGTGVLNGSLWTISVELQFYILVPVLYGLMGSGKVNSINRFLLWSVGAFLLLNIAFIQLEHRFDSQLWIKLVGVSFAPWLWMFLLGVLFQRNFDILHRWLAGRCVVVFLAYIAVTYALANVLGLSLGNAINPLSYVGLAMLVFSFAYSNPGLSETLLKGNDISYGVYIYHMPVFNLFIYYGLIGSVLPMISALIVAFVMAAVSWLLVERHCMKLKRHSLLTKNQ